MTLCALVILKSYEETHRSRERGRMVASIAREQLRVLSEENPHYGSPAVSQSWPDDFLTLKNWLISHSLKSQRPFQVAQDLHALTVRHSFSPNLQSSLKRWDDALQRWSVSVPEGHRLGAEDAFIEGRRRYFEATGFNKIGRQYDATGLYVWSVALLTQYIEERPFDERVPEALFFLGDSYLRLREGMPRNDRADRIINLCSELYPDSIWATRARALWRDEMNHVI